VGLTYLPQLAMVHLRPNAGVKPFPASTISMRRGGTASPGPLIGVMPEGRARELEQRYGFSDLVAARCYPPNNRSSMT
jgi:hypothetical protein